MEMMPQRSAQPATATLAEVRAPRAAGGAVPGSDSGWFTHSLRGLIYVTAFLVPILHLPFTPDALFIKVTVVEIAALAALVIWLLKGFLEKRLDYTRSPVNTALLAVAAVLVISNVFSLDRFGSFWGSDPTGETTAFLLSLITLSFLVSAVFSGKEVRRLSRVLAASFGLLALWTLVSLLGARIFPLPAFLQMNPVGSVNALAVVLAAGFLFSLGLALATRMSRDSSAVPEQARHGAGADQQRSMLGWVVAGLTFAALILLNFHMAWIGIAAVTAVWLALTITKLKPFDGFDKLTAGAAQGRDLNPSTSLRTGISKLKVVGAFLVLVFSLFVVLGRPNLAVRLFQPPLEISPAFGATLTIAGKVLREGRVLGSGPATFLIDYNRHRDSALNLTNFWALRFSHGFSFFTTILATLGVIGALALAWFVAACLSSFFRALWFGQSSEPLLLAGFLGMLLLFFFWFVYASNAAASFLLFIFVGMLGALTRNVEMPVLSKVEGSKFQNVELSWWRVSRRSIELQSPSLNFLVSLAFVFISAFAIITIYFLASQYAAEAAYGGGLRILNTTGNAAEAEARFNRARTLSPSEDRYARALGELALIRLQGIIQRVAAQAPSAELQNQFRNVLSAGVANAQAAGALNPHEATNWFILGQLFEAVTPFLAGADQASLAAYARARDADPLNPALPLAQGRLYLTVADLLQLQAAQASGQDQKRLFEARGAALERGREALKTSLDLKSDYAQAHFLLAQIAIRENKLDEAIRKTEETARLAPADIGVAFQLGFLYYRAERLDAAKAEFERAVLLNDNYSNARYFLGLIYDRKGDRDAARSQFQKIQALNPDNDEVARIIVNLRAGRPALDGIVPPAEAPERRKEAPVKARGEQPKSIRRR